MARPKKDSTEKPAKERLADAFLRLLEEYDVSRITVDMLCKEARCNRGTFYYHFPDMDSLIEYVVESLFVARGFPRLTFDILAGTGDVSFSSLVTSEWPERLALFIRHGKGVLVETIWHYVLRVWRAILCSDGREMSDQTCLILEYQVSGMLSMLSYMGEKGMEGRTMAPPVVFLSSVSKSAIHQICMLEGITEEELRKRFEMFDEISRLPDGRTGGSD